MKDFLKKIVGSIVDKEESVEIMGDRGTRSKKRVCRVGTEEKMYMIKMK